MKHLLFHKAGKEFTCIYILMKRSFCKSTTSLKQPWYKIELKYSVHEKFQYKFVHVDQCSFILDYVYVLGNCRKQEKEVPCRNKRPCVVQVLYMFYRIRPKALSFVIRESGSGFLWNNTWVQNCRVSRKMFGFSQEGCMTNCASG